MQTPLSMKITSYTYYHAGHRNNMASFYHFMLQMLKQLQNSIYVARVHWTASIRPKVIMYFDLHGRQIICTLLCSAYSLAKMEIRISRVSVSQFSLGESNSFFPAVRLVNVWRSVLFRRFSNLIFWNLYSFGKFIFILVFKKLWTGHLGFSLVSGLRFGLRSAWGQASAPTTILPLAPEYFSCGG